MPYIGPEVTAPLASAIAGLMGFIILFWRRFTGWVKRAWDRLFRRQG